MPTPGPADAEQPFSALADIRRHLAGFGYFLLGIMGLSFTGGSASAGLESGFSAPVIALVLLGLAVVAFACWRGVRHFRADLSQKLGPRERRWKWLDLFLLLSAGAVGIAITMATQGQGLETIFSNGAIPRAIAIMALIGWLALLAGLSAIGYHVTDEHQREANKVASTIGMTTYVAIAPTWWLAWRGGIAGEPQSMAIFLAVIAAAVIAYLWHQYR